jgi:3-hydroxyisobutyrate dehydrogenase-like beta-hydroxyacid dehydrogenase
VGSPTAVQIHDRLAERNIATLDSPVSGGAGGAEQGTLAVMVSGPRDEVDGRSSYWTTGRMILSIMKNDTCIESGKMGDYQVR